MILDSMIADLAGLGREGDGQAFGEKAVAIAEAIGSGDVDADNAQRGRLLKLVRDQRDFPALTKICHELIWAGYDNPANTDYDPRVRQELVQAMVDQGQLVEALDVIDQHRRNIESRAGRDHAPPDDPALNYAWGQAVGLTGRIHKQLYVDNATRPRSDRAVDHLLHAISWYALPFRARTGGDERIRPEDEWHAVNFVALLHRARKDGVAVPGEDADQRADELASVLAAKVAGQDAVGDPQPWSLATLGEALIAKGDWTGAAAAYARYASHPEVTRFQIYGSIRQLIEVWDLDGTEDNGQSQAVLNALGHRFAELSRANGPGDGDLFSLQDCFDDEGNRTWTLTITDPETQGRQTLQATSAAALQAIGQSLGDLPALMLIRAAAVVWSVGRVINNDTGETVGSGFLVKAGDLAPGLGDELLFLTNAHVVSDESDTAAADSMSARVSFDLARNAVHRSIQFKIDGIVWESPEHQLDACLMRLGPSAPWLEPLELHDPETFPTSIDVLPPRQRRCAAVGFAGTSSSRVIGDRHNLAIRDIGPRRPGTPEAPIFVHYSNQTRRGDSGGPVCNSEWKVIALHRAGATDITKLPALNGKRERVDVAEGVAIKSIALAVRRDAAAIAARMGKGGQQSQLPASLDPASVMATMEQHLMSADTLQRADLEALLLAAVPAPAAATGEHTLAATPATAEKGEEAGTAVLWDNVENTSQRAAISGFKDAFVVLASKLARRTRNTEFMQKASGSSRPRIVSDGDSWFQYPWPGVDDVIDQMAARHDYLIHCGALAGEEVRVRIAESDAAERVRELLPDAVMLSGGGNDLLGNGAIVAFLKPWQDGMRAADLIDIEGVTHAVEALVAQHRNWISRIRAVNPDVPIFNHGYDYAIPKRKGPWLDIPMSHLGIREASMQRQIVRHIIDLFSARMQAMTATQSNVHFVDCRGLVGTGSHWMDELHPMNDGFAKVADRFHAAIDRVLKRG